MMNLDTVDKSHKDFCKHEKQFKEGMQLYDQGCSAPTDKKTPQWHGWMAGLEMANIKRAWLETSRTHSGVN